MRIVHVLRRLTPAAWGGTEAVVTALARTQRERGHDVEILCTSALDRPGRGEVGGVPVTRFPYTYSRFPLGKAASDALDRKGGNPLSFGLLRALLEDERVDVYHCHTMQRLAGLVRWAARRKGVPYVVQLHGGAFDVPVAETREMLAPAGRSLDWGKVPAAIFGTRRFLSDADLVLALSAAEIERAKRQLPNTRIEFLPNGVSPERLTGGNRERARERYGIPPHVPLLLTIARVDPQKNQEILADVLAATPEAHAILAGPVTAPGYDARIAERARELGVASRVHLIGAVAPESEALADLYAAADLFVLPSRHEPFGIVILEAWATGLPVVASRVGGIAELVRDEVDGLLAEPGNASAFAAAAKRLLDDGSLRASMVDRARVRVHEHYTWDAVTTRLGELYGAIIGARQA